MIIVVFLIVGLLAAGAGYLAGIAHAVRVWRRSAHEAARVARGVPYPDRSCVQCRETFPDWFCWLGGCP